MSSPKGPEPPPPPPGDGAGAWPIPTEDPYPVLARLRSEAPVHRLEGLGVHLVVGYEDAHRILRSEAWSSNPARAVSAAGGMASLGGADSDLLAANVLLSDGDQHHHLRGALSGLLTPRAVGGLSPRITAVVDAVMAGHEPGERWDVLDEIAYPVPLAIMCELLDAGVDLAERLRDETRTLTALVDPMATGHEIEAGLSAATVLTFDMVGLVAERRQDPGEDVLSVVAGRLEPEEAVVMALLLLVAGHETTANLIAGAVVALHDHPDLARGLRRDPTLIGAAVEELLRWDAPVQLTSRVATETQRVGPVEVGPGEQVFISLGAANRDPAPFDSPNELRVDRRGPPHLAFGHGAHFCAGAALARAEASEVLRALVSLDPPIEERELAFRRSTSATFRRFDELSLSC
ncbi:MAG: cytochrome P450 [Acidimicrobiales bacterium]